MPPKKFLTVPVIGAKGVVTSVFIHKDSVDMYGETVAGVTIFVRGVELNVDLSLEDWEILLEDKKPPKDDD